LKLFEYGFQEACDANYVDMVLNKQRRWDGFECRWAVGRQLAAIEQEVMCRLNGVFWTVAEWGGQFVYFVQVRAWLRCQVYSLQTENQSSKQLSCSLQVTSLLKQTISTTLTKVT
jgi:hypothetical protein